MAVNTHSIPLSTVFQGLKEYDFTLQTLQLFEQLPFLQAGDYTLFQYKRSEYTTTEQGQKIRYIKSYTAPKTALLVCSQNNQDSPPTIKQFTIVVATRHANRDPRSYKFNPRDDNGNISKTDTFTSTYWNDLIERITLSRLRVLVGQSIYDQEMLTTTEPTQEPIEPHIQEPIEPHIIHTINTHATPLSTVFQGLQEHDFIPQTFQLFAQLPFLQAGDYTLFQYKRGQCITTEHGQKIRHTKSYTVPKTALLVCSQNNQDSPPTIKKFTITVATKHPNGDTRSYKFNLQNDNGNTSEIDMFTSTYWNDLIERITLSRPRVLVGQSIYDQEMSTTTEPTQEPTEIPIDFLTDQPTICPEDELLSFSDELFDTASQFHVGDQQKISSSEHSPESLELAAYSSSQQHNPEDALILSQVESAPIPFERLYNYKFLAEIVELFEERAPDQITKYQPSNLRREQKFHPYFFNKLRYYPSFQEAVSLFEQRPLKTKGDYTFFRYSYIKDPSRCRPNTTIPALLVSSANAQGPLKTQRFSITHTVQVDNQNKTRHQTKSVVFNPLSNDGTADYSKRLTTLSPETLQKRFCLSKWIDLPPNDSSYHPSNEQEQADATQEPRTDATENQDFLDPDQFFSEAFHSAP